MGGGGRGSAAPLPTLELYKEDLGIRPKRRGFVGLTHSTQEHPGLMDPGTPLSARNRIPLFFCFGPPNFARPNEAAEYYIVIKTSQKAFNKFS